MLHCGKMVQPTVILEELEKFPSSTQPAKVRTDAGIGFIKAVNNPQGSNSLASELIAAELGTWLGLSIPPFAILKESGLEISMETRPMEGPFFFSAAVEAVPRDGTDRFLKQLCCPEDVSKLVIFDTWIRNTDRFFEGEASSDNLLFRLIGKRRYGIVPIDHTHCFLDSGYFLSETYPDEIVRDEAVYGLFPEFEPFLKEAHVAGAIEKLRSLKSDFVQECLDALPNEWGVTTRQKDALRNMVCSRAEYVIETLPLKLVDQPWMPGLGAETNGE